MKSKMSLSRLLAKIYPALVFTTALVSFASTTLILSGEVQSDSIQNGSFESTVKNSNNFQDLSAAKKSSPPPLTS